MFQILRGLVAKVSYVAILRFWVILKGFYLMNVKISFKIEFFVNHLIVASIDVCQSYFAHTCCKIHLMLFCRKLTFVLMTPLIG